MTETTLTASTTEYDGSPLADAVPGALGAALPSEAHPAERSFARIMQIEASVQKLREHRERLHSVLDQSAKEEEALLAEQFTLTMDIGLALSSAPLWESDDDGAST